LGLLGTTALGACSSGQQAAVDAGDDGLAFAT